MNLSTHSELPQMLKDKFVVFRKLTAQEPIGHGGRGRGRGRERGSCG